MLYIYACMLLCCYYAAITVLCAKYSYKLLLKLDISPNSYDNHYSHLMGH